MKAAIEVKNVRKYFDDTKALDGITLNAPQGKIFGLLGPNGAGKTTLIRLLSTLLMPDQGTAKVMGIDVCDQPDKVRKLIGLAGQYAAVDEFLTGRENLYMVGRLYHLSRKEAKLRTQTTLEQLNLVDAANRPVRTYSGGMRRRLDVGASLVGNPKILFLDEPTTGLDPRTRFDLWHIIRGLARQGTTILLTTQYMEEADELADHIAVIDRGKLIAEGTSNQLKNRLGGDVIEFDLKDSGDQDRALRAVDKLAIKKPSILENGLTIKVPVKKGSKDLLSVVEHLKEANVPLSAIALHRPSLDDVFLSLTGKKTQDTEPKTRSSRRRGR